MLDIERSIDLLQIFINRDAERVMLRACKATMHSMPSDHEREELLDGARPGADGICDEEGEQGHWGFRGRFPFGNLPLESTIDCPRCYFTIEIYKLPRP